MRFNQQRAAFIQSIRDKSKSVLDERSQIVREVDEKTEKVRSVKTKQAEDEPKCEEYRQENIALTARMVAIKKVQEKTAEECEILKKDKVDILRRKASSPAR